MTCEVAQIDDARTDPLYEKRAEAKVGRHRSMLGVPLTREGVMVGAIGLSRGRVDPFSVREIELVTAFANQAVIAIENARLFEAEQQRTRELAEIVEQQAAASELLRIINSSPGALEPVFATMLEQAVRIAMPPSGISIVGMERPAIVATHNTPPAFADERRRLSASRGGCAKSSNFTSRTDGFAGSISTTRCPITRRFRSIATVASVTAIFCARSSRLWFGMHGCRPG